MQSTRKKGYVSEDMASFCCLRLRMNLIQNTSLSVGRPLSVSGALERLWGIFREEGPFDLVSKFLPSKILDFQQVSSVSDFKNTVLNTNKNRNSLIHLSYPLLTAPTYVELPLIAFSMFSFLSNLNVCHETIRITTSVWCPILTLMPSTWYPWSWLKVSSRHLTWLVTRPVTNN